MSDGFNIHNVENLITDSSSVELSDISKIIRKMINIKNDTTRERRKKTTPYDINDKISLNQFTDNLSEKIKRHHINSYDIVDDAITCIEEVEASIRSDLYDYFSDVYGDVLSEMKISINDEESIKRESDIIYRNLLIKIDSQIFSGKNSNIETNKKSTYLNAIASYVFYQCKFLIPIEG